MTRASLIGEARKKADKDVAERANMAIQDILVREKKLIWDISKFTYVIGVIAPVLALIQLVEMYLMRTVSDISLFYWVSYLIAAGAWFGYGVRNKNKPLMFSYGLWIIVEILAISGILAFS